MEKHQTALFPAVAASCKQLELDEIAPERQAVLEVLSGYLLDKWRAGEEPAIMAICTHNSRRSHMAQLWLAVAADFYGLPTLHTFSGGTEATAFYVGAVDALLGLGFLVAIDEPQVDNPIYWTSWREGQTPLPAFSKRYDHGENPSEGFAALLVCAQADEACPVVRGAAVRIVLPYEDPKVFDGMPEASTAYAVRCREIGGEMLWVMRRVKEMSQ